MVETAKGYSGAWNKGFDLRVNSDGRVHEASQDASKTTRIAKLVVTTTKLLHLQRRPPCRVKQPQVLHRMTWAISGKGSPGPIFGL